jgi:hypothetical protein
MIDINNLTNTETELKESSLSASEELNLSADSEGYLNELSEQEEVNIHGGRWVDDPCRRTVWVD